jgi:protein-S-isoprenylcysteine O-methyltransferase Ste14
MPIPPPALALAAALVQRALTRGAPPPTSARNAGAGVVTALSVGLAGAASTKFHRVGTTVDPVDPTRASVLITTGVNSITRNPMYIGLSGVLVAYAIRRGAWLALLPVAAFVALIDRVQIAAEEKALSARFGADYDAYRAQVPRWLAWPNRSRGT